MSSEGQIQDPETKATDTPSPEIEVFEQHRHPTHIGEELRALLSLAIPVVLSELGWMTMTIVDLIMVGRLGPDAIGAVGLGNAVYYAPSLFGIGLLLGLDTLVSQSWGAGRFDDCHRSLAQAIYIALAFTPLLMLFMLAAQWIFTGRGVDPTVAVLTRSYVGILNWGTFPLLVYGGFRRYLQGVGRVRLRNRGNRQISQLQTPLWVDILPKRANTLGRMATRENNDDRIALLQGTLDLLILKTLALGSCHGQGVARLIQRQSEEVFLVDHGSLYVALQRLEGRKWIAARWGVSENNRRARFYSLTPKGREYLVEKTSEWQRLTRAMGRILDANHGPQGEEA